MVPPRSIDELAEAIGRLAADENLRQRLGNNGRERFTDQFRHEFMTERIREVYQSVLDS